MSTRNLRAEASRERMVASFLTIRNTVGVLGVLLPAALLLGDWFSDPRETISSYYHTEHLRDIFVGVLVAIGVCLWAYKGYEKSDDLLGDIAGASAVAVAILPTGDGFIGFLHYTAAVILFASLAAYSLWLFPKTEIRYEGPPQGQMRCLHYMLGKWLPPCKRRRNWVYYASGVSIVFCVLAIVVASLADWHGFPRSVESPLTLPPAVFTLETVALWSFGVAWFTKGRALLILRRSARSLIDKVRHDQAAK